MKKINSKDVKKLVKEFEEAVKHPIVIQVLDNYKAGFGIARIKAFQAAIKKK